LLLNSYAPFLAAYVNGSAAAPVLLLYLLLNHD